MSETPTDETGCDCVELCSMGPTCPGGMLAGLPGAGCWRARIDERVDVVHGFVTHNDASQSPVERWVRASDGRWVSLDSERTTQRDPIWVMGRTAQPDDSGGAR